MHEVIGAAERARAALAGASRHLDSAGNWATYDTFGGGGFLADMMKRQKMDQAVELMRNADESLRVLSRVHQGAVERAAALETRLAQLAERRETLLTGV